MSHFQEDESIFIFFSDFTRVPSELYFCFNEDILPSVVCANEEERHPSS